MHSQSTKGLLTQLGGLVMLAMVVALMTLMFSIAQPIAIIVLGLFLSAFLFAIILVAPEPGYKVEKLAYVLLLLFSAFLVLWPRYALLRIPGLFGVSPARITLAALLFVWLYLILRSPSFRARLLELMDTVKPITYSMIVLFIFKFLGLFETDSVYLSLKGILNELFTAYLLFPIALSLVNSDRRIRNLILVLAISGVISALLGVYESIISHNIFLGYLEIDSDYIAQNLMDKLRAGAYRIQSTFSHPLTFSEFLAMLTPLLAMASLNFPHRILKGVLVLIVMPLFLYVIIKSGSRSGVVAFAFSITVMVTLVLYRYAKMSRDIASSALTIIAVLVVLLVAAFVGYLMMDFVAGRTAGEARSGYARIAMWTSGLSISFDKPIFGHGQDMATQVLGYSGGDQLTIDSYYLNILLDSGFVAFFAYCFMLVYTIVKGISFGVKNSCSRGNHAIAISTSVVLFSAIKLILSLSHNHGILFVLIGALFQVISSNIYFQNISEVFRATKIKSPIVPSYGHASNTRYL